MRLPAFCLPVAALIAHPASAQSAAPVPASKWTAALSTGVNAYDGDTARPFGALAVDHAGDRLTLGIAASIVDSSEVRPRFTLPSTTAQLTLSAGYRLGAATLDGYAMVGRRRFRAQRVAGASLAADGTTLGAGASLTYDVPLGAALALSPYLAVDYGRVDQALVVTAGAGSTTRTQRQTGVTGALGTALTAGFGNGHQAGVTLAALATSNDAASGGSGAGRFGRGGGSGDQWVEAGASASFALSRRLRLDLGAVRTIGLAAGDATTGTLTLRAGF